VSTATNAPRAPYVPSGDVAPVVSKG